MSSHKSRQRRALAAGGLVLGIGSVLVAASWTDSVLGFANFQSGSRFGIQSSVNNGATWSSNPTSGATNKLNFAPAMTGLVPGSVAYAAIQLRTEVGSSSAGVSLSGALLTGDATLGGALVYRAVRLPTVGTSCNSAAFTEAPAWIVGVTGAVPLTAGSAGKVMTLPAATATAAGPATGVCFELSLPANAANWTNAALQGKTSTPDWAFVGTS